MKRTMTLALLASFSLATIASGGVVTVDDFSAGSVDTNLWSISGGVSQSGGEVELPGGALLEQAQDLIPLPTQPGETLIVEYAVRSSDSALTDTVSVILRGMDASGNYASKWLGGIQIRSDNPGDYTARNATAAVKTNVPDYGTSYDVHQTVYTIDGGGTKKFSAQVLKSGDAAWTTMISEYNVDWTFGGSVAQLQFYATLTGSGSPTFVDYVQYDLVPEPATMGVLAAGGLLVLRRRKR